MRVIVVVCALTLIGSGCKSSSSGSDGSAGGASGSGGSGTGGTGGSGSGGTGGSGGGSGGSGGSAGSGGTGGTGGNGDGGGGCGYMNEGTPLHIAAGLDVCVPPSVCDPETCPPTLAQCVNGKCVFGSGYSGLQTLPQAWVTHYCALSTGGCHGVTQDDFPENTAQQIATTLGHSVCDQTAGDKCIGIAATSPILDGNAQTAIDPATGKSIALWGLGLSEASGLCYQLTGPGGTAIVAITDRCGGYCQCSGSAFMECGPCANSSGLTPNCPCVGTAGAMYTACCGRGCPSLNAQCDWCASSNHPHFDLDDGTFNYVCGSQSNLGSCQLTAVSFIPCLSGKKWPP